MAALTRAQIPDSALGSAEKLAAYAASLLAYGGPSVKRQEIVGGAAIPAYTADPTKFPSGEAFLVCRMTIPLNSTYQSAGGAIWTHALLDPNQAVVEPGYKQVGT